MNNQSLEHYAKQLRAWNKKINLVGPDTLKELEERHIQDCKQLIDYLDKEHENILDIGTGAGLPGLILAILAPQHHITMVESDSRKCAFLMTMVQDLGLQNVTIKNQRLETVLETETFTTITARAFAPLHQILEKSQSMLTPNGQWLLLKGEAVDEELRACETLFPMTVERFPSIVPTRDGKQGWVLKIRLK